MSMEPQTAALSTSGSDHCELKKEAALSRLLTGQPVAEVAKEIGVCKKDVSRWLCELLDAKYLEPTVTETSSSKERPDNLRRAVWEVTMARSLAAMVDVINARNRKNMSK